MICKKSKIYNILQITSIACLLNIFNALNASALEVTEVPNLLGVQTGYQDPDIPVAIKVTKDGDGIKAGAYLYRYVHEGIDYYAPWTPESIRETDADHNKSAYDNWGFWNMEANQESHSITAVNYYTKGTINTDGTKANNTLGDARATFSKGKVIKIYGVDTDRVIINANDYAGVTQGSSPSELLAIEKKYVDLNSEDKMSLMYPGYLYNKEGDANKPKYLHNFKAGAKYKYNARPIHYGVEAGRWVNPSGSHVPEEVRGKSGEWRYIGYNRYGDPLDNPYFLADSQGASSTYIYGAERRHTPWDKTDQKEGESDAETAYAVFVKGMNKDSLKFEYDTLPEFDEMKDYVVDRLYKDGIIKTKNNVKNEFSLRTNAYKQGIVLKNQRKASVLYSVPFINGTLRDLYAYSMEIWEVESNKKIASVLGSASGSKVVQSGQYTPGRNYEAKIRLGNNADAELIKKSLETQFGLIYNAASIDDSMAFKKTKNQQTLTMGDRGGLKGEKGAKSDEFVFKFSVSSNQTGPIDVYGFVGFSHTGVDNLQYDNDLIGIRLTENKNPDNDDDNGSDDSCIVTNGGKTKICGKADIKPVSIQLIDEAGTVQYEYNAEKGVTKQKAIIPGKEYKIRYNAQVTDDTVKVHEWIDAVSDDPNTEENEYKPGQWADGVVFESKIPLTYNITRPVKNPATTESYSSNASKLYFEKNGSTSIKIQEGSTMSYTTDYIMMQYPKLTTSFTIKSTEKNVNSNAANDTLSTTVADTFDISVNNLVVTPIVSYTNGKEREVSYNVTYDVNLVTPSYVSKDDYQAYVNTAININGQIFNVKDQLIKGNNTGLSHTINSVKIPSSGELTASVNVNSDKLSYESGDYSNNKASSVIKIEKIKNPITGSADDTVKSPVQDDNNPSAGGNANNNCLIPRTKNTWTSTHRKLSWNSNTISYNTLVTKDKVSFQKYNISYYNDKEAIESYEETFKIKEILFKSKETTDRGYGTDGWVNLLKTEEAKYAQVKAGYGFELKIVTNYNTNATTKRVWNLMNNGSSGTDVSFVNGGINYGMEEIFLELPGTKETRKILSSTGYGDSIKGLNVSRSGSSNDVTWTYTIKSSNTTGGGEAPKIFIPQDMKDGDYKLKIYTTPVEGVGSANKKKYSALCDRKEVTIKVKGAASDDLDSNIIQ